MIKTWKCPICESIQKSDSSVRHQMDWCKCRETAVDLEEHYERRIGQPMDLADKVSLREIFEDFL